MSHGTTWWKWGNPRFVIVTPYIRCINRPETIRNHPKLCELCEPLSKMNNQHKTQKTKVFLRIGRGQDAARMSLKMVVLDHQNIQNTLESSTSWLYAPSNNIYAWYTRYVHSHLSETTWNLAYYNLCVYHRAICPSFFINLRVYWPSWPKYVSDGHNIKYTWIWHQCTGYHGIDMALRVLNSPKHNKCPKSVSDTVLQAGYGLLLTWTNTEWGKTIYRVEFPAKNLVIHLDADSWPERSVAKIWKK